MAFLDDGSWTKRLHPGWAASSALQAAALGVSGFEGPDEAYGGRFGFYALYAPGTAIETATISDQLFTEWALRAVAIKPYPICHFNHAPVDAALALREQYNLSLDEIASITVLLHERQFGVIVDPIESKRAPQGEYDAKFSVPYAVATALASGRFGLAELDDAARLDSDVLALAQRINCEHDARSRYPDAFSGGVRVLTVDGRVLEHFEEINRGAAGRLLGAEQVYEKFMANCALTISHEQAEALWQSLQQMDELENVTGLMGLLRTETNKAS
jgi:2-methylcitrate dehydratase PrpD